jgi:uncharacterized protein YhaN
MSPAPSSTRTSRPGTSSPSPLASVQLGAASARSSPGTGQASPWKDRALNAEDTLKTAYAEISSQRNQIGKLLGRIRDLELGLPADAVDRINAENKTLRQENRKLAAENQQVTERLKAARDNNRFLDTRIRPPRSRPRRISPCQHQRRGQHSVVTITARCHRGVS